MKFPQVKPEYFPLAGGLDIVTPAISIGPGKVFDAQNYEPEISGGYRRINGFERYDGQDAPTDADYWVMTATIAATISIGSVIVGASSLASGWVLGVFSSTLVLGRVSGSFIVGESLTVSAIAVATATTTAYQNGASAPSDDADYALLAADDQRQNILKVPGSGRIRGVPSSMRCCMHSETTQPEPLEPCTEPHRAGGSWLLLGLKFSSRRGPMLFLLGT